MTLSHQRCNSAAREIKSNCELDLKIVRFMRLGWLHSPPGDWQFLAGRAAGGGLTWSLALVLGWQPG